MRKFHARLARAEKKTGQDNSLHRQIWGRERRRGEAVWRAFMEEVQGDPELSAKFDSATIVAFEGLSHTGLLDEPGDFTRFSFWWYFALCSIRGEEWSEPLRPLMEIFRDWFEPVRFGQPHAIASFLRYFFDPEV